MHVIRADEELAVRQAPLSAKRQDPGLVTGA
jgi:hypothetical protein